MENIIVDNAKVMAKGQITLPKQIRAKLGIATGDRVALIWDGEQVVLMNAAVFAMKLLQKGMAGEAREAGLQSEEDIVALVRDVRAEMECL